MQHRPNWGVGVDPRLHDFRNFLWLVWKHLNLPAPTHIQYDIAHTLQDWGIPRVIIMGFRGLGKSWVTASFVCWCLLMDRDVKILIASGAKDKADEISEFIQRLIDEMPELAHLRPKGSAASWSKVKFTVAGCSADIAPSVKSAGILGSITGSRADIILGDDVETPNNSETQGMREKLSERVKEFDAILKPEGRIIFLGTPQTNDTVYGKLQDRGYVARIWPILVPDDREVELYGEALAPCIIKMRTDGVPAGKTTEPSRFTDDNIAERLLSYGRAGFQLQFMLNPSLADADKFPLKVRDLVIMPVGADTAPQKVVWRPHPSLVINDLPNVGMRGDRMYHVAEVVGEEIPYTGSVMVIDPSGRGSDETSYAVLKMLHGYLYLSALGGMKGGYSDDTLISLSKMAATHKVNKVLIESNFGDGMFNKLLQPFLRKHHPVSIEEVRHSIQKEKRIIDTLEPVLMQHRLVIDPQIIEDDYKSIQQYRPEVRMGYSLIYQLTRITKERGALKHDDRLDALAMAVAYWTERMSMDADVAMRSLEEEDRQRKLDSFLKEIGHGHSNSNTMW